MQISTCVDERRVARERNARDVEVRARNAGKRQRGCRVDLAERILAGKRGSMSSRRLRLGTATQRNSATELSAACAGRCNRQLSDSRSLESRSSYDRPGFRKQFQHRSTNFGCAMYTTAHDFDYAPGNNFSEWIREINKF
jgi:hypothetical protein